MYIHLFVMFCCRFPLDVRRWMARCRESGVTVRCAAESRYSAGGHWEWRARAEVSDSGRQEFARVSRRQATEKREREREREGERERTPSSSSPVRQRPSPWCARTPYLFPAPSRMRMKGRLQYKVTMKMKSEGETLNFRLPRAHLQSLMFSWIKESL